MRAIGIVLAGGNSKRMRELSNKRAVAAMGLAMMGIGASFCLEELPTYSPWSLIPCWLILRPAAGSSPWQWD